MHLKATSIGSVMAHICFTALWTTHLQQFTAHGSIFILSSGFRKVATSVSWADLTGIKVVQRRRVSRYICFGSEIILRFIKCNNVFLSFEEHAAFIFSGQLESDFNHSNPKD